jgi:hypothetical protein
MPRLTMICLFVEQESTISATFECPPVEAHPQAADRRMARAGRSMFLI